MVVVNVIVVDPRTPIEQVALQPGHDSLGPLQIRAVPGGAVEVDGDDRRGGVRHHRLLGIGGPGRVVLPVDAAAHRIPIGTRQGEHRFGPLQEGVVLGALVGLDRDDPHPQGVVHAGQVSGEVQCSRALVVGGRQPGDSRGPVVVVDGRERLTEVAPALCASRKERSQEEGVQCVVGGPDAGVETESLVLEQVVPHPKGRLDHGAWVVRLAPERIDRRRHCSRVRDEQLSGERRQIMAGNSRHRLQHGADDHHEYDDGERPSPPSKPPPTRRDP